MLNSQGFNLWADGYDKSVELTDKNNDYLFAGYEKLMGLIYSMAMRKSPAKIFDIGIGTGTLSSKLYEHGNEITGIDFSGDMLEISRSKMPKAHLIQWDFSLGVPDEIGNKKFDFIISTYALHHLPDGEKHKLIISLLEYLEKDGSVIIGDVSFQNRDELQKCRVSCGDGWDEAEEYFVFDELNDSLRDKCRLKYHQISHCSGVVEIFER